MTSQPKVSSRLASCFAILAVLFLTAVPLHAHHLPPGMEDVDEFADGAAFMAGVRHPLTGLDHWMFAVVIGALAMGFLSGRAARGLHVALLTGVSLGAMAGLNGLVLPGLQFSLLLAMTIPVLMILLKGNKSLGLPMALTGIVALWQGNAHGLAWPLDVASGFYLAGLLTMTSLLAIVGSAVVRAAQGASAVRRSSSIVTSL